MELRFNHVQMSLNCTKYYQIDNIIDSDYNIEVSSPGINRPLFNIRDFAKYQGERVFVEFKRNINNHKRFTGTYKIINNKIVFQNQRSLLKYQLRI